MHGCEVAESLYFLKPVLDGFHKNMENYSTATEWVDLPYNYNERATLSIFSGACWQKNMIAIEEYIATKGRGAESCPGRPDLWMYCPKTDMSVTIEAKQQWPTLGFHDETPGRWFEKADADAAKNYESKIRAGLTFVTPIVPPGTDLDEVMELFDRIRSSALGYGADAVAWWIPPRALDCVFDSADGKGRHVYPGVFTVIRIARIRGQGPIAKKNRLPVTEWSEMERA
jgi:hypothetical protein